MFSQADFLWHRLTVTYVPSKEPATDRNKEKYTPRETTSDWGWAIGTVMIISGTVLIVGTVAEDFFTFGAGTVDDIPSFIAAEELMRNGIMSFAH